jgi:protein-L-isoaspartate(D-aspartate) O-methyltransferase
VAHAAARAIGMLRFGGPCTKDDAVFELQPAAMSARFQGPSMSGFSTARQKMVDGQVRPSDITDSRIIDAMLDVPREAFVPESQRALAYLDLDLDVSEGTSEKRFLIKPAVTAKMLQAAEITNTDRVLVVGCATGYVAALVAKLAGQVTATESEASLSAKAVSVLAGIGLGNVTVKTAAAADGDPASAPFDVIFLNGATAVTPDRLYRQLKEGGRLVGVFATTQPPRAVIVTHSHDDFGHRALFDATVPVLPGLERLPAFVF